MCKLYFMLRKQHLITQEKLLFVPVFHFFTWVCSYLLWSLYLSENEMSICSKKFLGSCAWPEIVHSVNFNKFYFMINSNPFISFVIQYLNILPKSRPFNPEVFTIFVYLRTLKKQGRFSAQRNNHWLYVTKKLNRYNE